MYSRRFRASPAIGCGRYFWPPAASPERSGRIGRGPWSCWIRWTWRRIRRQVHLIQQLHGPRPILPLLSGDAAGGQKYLPQPIAGLARKRREYILQGGQRREDAHVLEGPHDPALDGLVR